MKHVPRCPNCGRELPCGCCEGCGAPRGAEHSKGCSLWDTQMLTNLSFPNQWMMTCTTTAPVIHPTNDTQVMTNPFTIDLRALRGLRDGVLVAGDEETEGDAPGRCRTCKESVRIQRGYISLFGGESPPEVRCTSCEMKRQDEQRKERDAALTVNMKELEVQHYRGEWTSQKVSEAMKRVQDAFVQEKVVTCQACGTVGNAPMGQRNWRCNQCMRREWRRGR